MPQGRRVACLLVAIAVAGCGQPGPSASERSSSPSTPPGAQAAPTEVPTKPYRLRLNDEDRDHVIESPADCAYLPTDWLIE
jgi:hypothetical protein